MSIYDLNSSGIITNPGKYEGEMYYVPEYWQDACCATDIIDHNDDSITYIFEFDNDDYAKHPKLEGYFAMGLYEDSQGFVSSILFESETELDEYLGKIALDNRLYSPTISDAAEF